MSSSEMAFNYSSLQKDYRFAKALFDNSAETPDELSFRRGDVLTVLSQNSNSLLKGWTLCVNHSDGRTGLAPANRLRLIPVPCVAANTSGLLNTSSNSCCALSDRSVETMEERTRRRSWNSFSKSDNRAAEEYDIPAPNTFPKCSSSINLYDFPISATNCRPISDTNDNNYDIPIPLNTSLLLMSSPDSSSGEEIKISDEEDVRRRLSDDESAQTIHSNDSSLDSFRSLYSIPRKVLPKRAEEDFYCVPLNNRSVMRRDQPIPISPDLYDEPKGQKRLEKSEDMSSMTDCLERLEETETNCLQTLNSLFANFCFGTDWRTNSNLKSNQRVIEFMRLCHDLRRFLRQFVSLCLRCVLSAKTNCSDVKITTKLDQLLQQLSTSLNIIDNTIDSMNSKHMWTLVSLVRSSDVGGSECPRDDCDRLVCCAKGLAEDVKHIKAFIRGNAKLLLQTVTSAKPPIAPKPTSRQPMRAAINTRPLPKVPKQADQDYEDLSTHDYVCLESKETIESQIETKDKSKGEIERTAEEVLDSYRSQMSFCAKLLKQSIEAMIESIHKNHFLLPKVSLLNESKFVVICAQKLLFVSQTMSRRTDWKKCSDGLTHFSDSLKAFVEAVRRASLTGRSFPTNQSVESVFEALIELSLLSNQMLQTIK